MGNIATSGGTGGVGSDECTAVLAHVLAGEKAVTSDSGDEAGTGTMTVNSLLSFSCAAYSGRRVLAKWQNPKAAKGKPYSGVYIRYSTNGYPGKTGGTQIYKGAGNNTASEGQSQTYLDLPALNTTYYLSIYPYVTCSAGEMTGGVINTSVKTSAQLILTIKGTQNYTIPIGFTQADIFCVGAGGSGGSMSSKYTYGGGGGGSGYTATTLNTAVSAGQVLSCVVGSGVQYGNGNPSYVDRGGVRLCTADGGKGADSYEGAYGGSGGGGGGQRDDNSPGGNGGSDGSRGYSVKSGASGGGGQGRSTRAFGESSGTLYAGGGGAGGALSNSGSGGAGGGGGGGGVNSWGGNGTANTGGGGGGEYYSNGAGPGTGGSGIILLRLK